MFKKILCAFFAIILLMTSLSSGVFAKNDFISGDVDGDMIVSAKDSAIIARYVAGWKDYKNTDGSITFPTDLSKDFEERNKSGFGVGYRREVITPYTDGTVPLGGYGNSYNRLGKGKYDDNCITCVAFKDNEGEIVLMVSIDILNILKSTSDAMRNAISAKTGVPYDHITISCTHTHNGPDTHAGYVGTINSVDKYLFKLYRKAADCCLYAIRDIDSSNLYIGKTETKDISFVRRYKVNYSSSALQGALKDVWEGCNPNDSIGAYKGFETAPDESVQYLLIERENQKNILLYNWQCHSAITGSVNYFTADFINASRNKLEKDLGVYSVYFQGACGNINTSNPIWWTSSPSGYEASQKIGTSLANVIENHYNGKKYSKVASGDIQVNSGTYFAKYYDNSDEAQKTVTWRKNKFGETITLDKAKELVYQYAKAFDNAFASDGSKMGTAATAARKNLYQQTGIAAGYYYAHNMVLKYNRTHGKDNPGYDIPYSAFTIGKNVAFAFVPYEMFDTDAMDIKYGYHYIDNAKGVSSDMNNGNKSTTKTHSNFGTTFVVELTNDSQGYVPSDLAWSHGGYEVNSSYFVSGTGSAIASKLITMLNGLYSKAN